MLAPRALKEDLAHACQEKSAQLRSVTCATAQMLSVPVPAKTSFCLAAHLLYALQSRARHRSPWRSKLKTRSPPQKTRKPNSKGQPTGRKEGSKSPGRSPSPNVAKGGEQAKARCTMTRVTIRSLEHRGPQPNVAAVTTVLGESTRKRSPSPKRFPSLKDEKHGDEQGAMGSLLFPAFSGWRVR